LLPYPEADFMLHIFPDRERPILGNEKSEVDIFRLWWFASISLFLACFISDATGCTSANAARSSPSPPSSSSSALPSSQFVVGDPYITVQAAMDAANAVGGGVILIPDGNYAGPSNFYSGVYLEAEHPSRPDLCVEALGANGCPSPHALTASAILTFSKGVTITDLNNIGIVGLTLDFSGSTSGYLTLAGVAQSNFDMTINNCALSAPCLTLQGSVANNLNKNTFPYLGVAGGSEGIRFQPSSSGEGAYVNHFGFVIIAELGAPSGTYTALDFNALCDTNDFTEVGFYSNQASANGVIFNSASSTADEDANGIIINNFWSTAPDFASGTGITFNPSSGNYIRTGVLNWNNFAPCGTSSLYCAATGGPANSPNFTWIQADATASRIASLTANRILQPLRASFADTTACVAGSKAISFATPFSSGPVVLVFDETTAGGTKLSGKSASGFTVNCAGPTDTFDWVAIGNPN
jgi:hypothetical protein